MKKLTSIHDFIALKRNTKIKVSDGMKEPPKHHTKKHASWKHRNYVGFLYGTEQFGGPLYVRVTDKIGSMLVNCYPINGSLSFFIEDTTTEEHS